MHKAEADLGHVNHPGFPSEYRGLNRARVSSVSRLGVAYPLRAYSGQCWQL